DQSLVSKKFKTVFKEQDIKLVTDNYQLVDNETISNSLKNEDDVLVTLFLPYDIIDGYSDYENPQGKIFACHKLLVNAKTCDVVAIASLTILGLSTPSNLQKGDMKDFAKCK